MTSPATEYTIAEMQAPELPAIPLASQAQPETPSDFFMQSSPAGGGVNIEAYDTPTASTFLEPSSNKRKFNDDADDEDSEDGEDEEIEESPKKKAKRANHRTSKKAIEGRMIPRTLDECEDIDKNLINMRDSGKGWPEIRKMWQDATGERTGKSTLPNRYMRLKLNFTNLSDDDNARLLKCHREVEEAFEKERWSLVSRSMSREGSENYVPEVLQRQYKKLTHQGANLREGRDMLHGWEEED